MIDLTEEQIERYSRHILLQDVGLEGQEKLLNAKVLIIGAGNHQAMGFHHRCHRQLPCEVPHQ